MGEAWEEVHEHGWEQTWNELQSQLDVNGEKHAFAVMGLDPEQPLTTKELRSARKRLVLRWHPDKQTTEAVRLHDFLSIPVGLHHRTIFSIFHQLLACLPGI